MSSQKIDPMFEFYSEGPVNPIPLSHVHVFLHLYIVFVCSRATCKTHLFLKAVAVYQYFSHIPRCSHIDSYLVETMLHSLCNTHQLWHDSLWGALFGGLILLTVYGLATNSSFLWRQPEPVCENAIPSFSPPGEEAAASLSPTGRHSPYSVTKLLPLPLWWRSKRKW